MKQILSEVLIDLSNQDQFCFAVVCTECGSQWKSTPVRFSKAGVVPQTEEKKIIFRTLYQREWEKARLKAIDDAMHIFNCCPMCGRLVCNDCFMICDELDMCKTCSKWLKEHGEPIMSNSVGSV